jgi:hypothetical protein
LFLNFLSPNGKKRLVFNLNGQIRIQTIEYEFKQINQEMTPHYRPPTPATDGSAGGIT